MITKRDCILLLSELSQQGVTVDPDIMNAALRSTDVNVKVVEFINKHRRFEANEFYEKLRKSYNNKKSSLYKNIVTCDETDCTETVLTTLSALLLQITLYLKNIENTRMFLSHLRFEEITQVLLNYSQTFDLVPCIKVLQIIKADLKAFEYMNKNI